jgi:hypothetical protein
MPFLGFHQHTSAMGTTIATMPHMPPGHLGIEYRCNTRQVYHHMDRGV